MRNQLKTFYSALLIVATLGLTSTVHGIPAFARQTGLECSSCHAASGFPVLNAFGQAFKAGGYSQANEDDLIGDGETLSIPKTLNASIVLKVRNPIGTTGPGETDTESKLELPDEAGLIFGGRIAKDMGFMLEYSLAESATANAKFMFAPEIGPVRLGIVGWLSADGPGMMFENLSTAQIANIRPTERDKGAAHEVGFHDGSKGVGLYVWHPMGYIVFTPVFGGGADALWSNSKDSAAATDNFGYYIRVAATPTFGNVALGIGAAYLGGSKITNSYSTTGTTVDAETGEFSAGKTSTPYTYSSFIVDAQAFMDVGLPLSIYASYGMDVSSDNAETSTSAASLYAEVGIVPDVFLAGPKFAWKNQENSKTDTLKFGAVAKYYLFRNVKLELDFTFTTVTVDGSDANKDEWEIMPMVFAAF
jgi:hypothetical protein